MRVGATISLLLHLALVLIFVFGLPNFFAPDEFVEAIPVQIVTNISDRTTQTEMPPPAPPQKPKPPQLAEKPKKEPEEKPAPERDITSVLKNVEKLAQQSPDAPEPAQEPSPPQTASQAPLGEELSTSERDAIASQIEQCWIVDVGMQGIEEIVVALNVQFNPDGSVYRIDFADPLQIAADQRFRVLAERARAAVQECSPIRVSSNYNNWKNLTFRFNPKGMLGL